MPEDYGQQEEENEVDIEQPESYRQQYDQQEEENEQVIKKQYNTSHS